MYFVRLQGCQVGCYFCDTKYTWRPSLANKSEHHIVNRAKKHDVQWVCVTGGEPYEQNLKTLVECCHDKDLKIHIETSGEIWHDWDIDWICVSPKDLFSKKSCDPKFFFHADEIKCVVTKESDIDYYLERYHPFEQMQQNVKDNRIPLIFQPVDNNIDLINMIMEKTKKLSDVRIMMQQHKVMNLQ